MNFFCGLFVYWVPLAAPIFKAQPQGPQRPQRRAAERGAGRPERSQRSAAAAELEALLRGAGQNWGILAT